MTEDFTASNGVRIRGGEWGHYEYMVKNGTGFSEAGRYAQGSPLDLAMGEYYRAREDERLGRWRWPENPDYVVYPCSVRSRVRVLQETGTGDLEWVDEGDGRSYEFVHAARAYFDAHPEPKPWHEAEPGEVWLLTLHEGPYVSGDWSFIAADHAVPQDDPRITSARKIWPQGGDDD